MRTARRHIVDLMLANHYGDCYACKRNNNCELQSLAKEYGVDFFRFGHPTEPRYPIDRTSSAIVRDMNKCVLCRRCVRTCTELQGVGCLTVKDRSARSQVATFGDKPLSSRGLHQLRTVHQPLSDRRADRARPDRRGLGDAR